MVMLVTMVTMVAWVMLVVMVIIVVVKLARAMRLMDKTPEACRTLDLMGKQFPKASAVAKPMAAQERQYAKCA